MAQCTAKSKRSGERCKNPACKGRKTCRMHGGTNPGAPKGSKNALKHGAYETITRSTMTEEEIEFTRNLSFNEVSALEEHLRILNVKKLRIERRMKRALDAEELAGKDDGTGKKAPNMVILTGSQVMTENFAGDKSKTVSTNSETHEMHYLRLEQAHSVILNDIRRTLESIAKIKDLQAGEEDSAVPEKIEVIVVDGRRRIDEDGCDSSDAE